MTGRSVPERKHVAVLFADISGSTQGIGDDPEDAAQFLDPPLELMEDAVQLFGGTISDIAGDGVLALFGAPMAQEDYALLACRAGQEIQKRVETWNRNVADGRGPIKVRVGIACGEVLVKRSKGTSRPYGMPVYVAKRLESAAEPGTVAISREVLRLIDNRIDATPIGSRVVKNLTIEVFRLALQSPVASFGQRRHSSSLVGRHDLLATLDVIAAYVPLRRLRAVGLIGEAGAGKSRVATELAERLRAQGFGVFAAAGQTYTRRVQYGVVAGLARVLLSSTPLSDERALMAGVDAAIGAAPASGRVTHAGLIDLLGLEAPGPAPTPIQRRRRMGEALRWLVEMRAADRPVLLVVEDIGFADPESQRMLDQVLRHIDRLPVMCCCTYRDGYHPPWSDAPWFSELRVRLLTRTEAGALAAELLGADPSLHRALDELLDKADGNPFYLEQMAMTLIDAGVLVGSRGNYRCVRLDAEVKVPASIAVNIGARIDRLPEAAKATLEAAAIIGEPRSTQLLGSMQNLPADAVQEHLALATDAGLVVADGDAPLPTCAFRHALVREVIESTLPRTRLRQLHRAAFTALRPANIDPPPDDCAVLAQHAFAGEMWPEAAECARISMLRAIALSASNEALEMLALGREATGRVGAVPLRDELELSLLTESLGALLPLGRVDDILDNLARAGELARHRGDVRRVAAVLLQLAVMQWTGGRYAEGLTTAHQASEAALTANSRSLQMAAAQACMMLHHGVGNYARTLDDARAIERDFAAELAASRVMPGWAVLAGVNVKVFAADVLIRMADFAGASVECNAAERELAANEHAFSRAMTNFVKGTLLIERGDSRDAERLLRDTLALCDTADVPAMRPPILALLYQSVAMNGAAAAAATELRRAVTEKLYQRGGRYNDFYLPFSLALALGRAQDFAGAREAALEAVAAAKLYGQQGHQAQALEALAEIERHAGWNSEAILHYRQAIALARECSATLIVQRSMPHVEGALGLMDADVPTA